jgi:LmbE family N-acetylglucosaminyl deacetylase
MSLLNYIEQSPTQTLDASDVAIVIAHPDDEAIACGALMSRLRNVNVVFVTDGSPAHGVHAARAGFASVADYAAARARELRAALAIAGVGEEQIIELGAPDGLVWQSMISIVQRLGRVFDQRHIRAVFTHAFEGGHSDHDGVAYCAHLAAGIMGSRAPRMIEMPLYHERPDGIARQLFCDGEEGVVARLTEAQQRAKMAMFAAHATQAHVLQHFDPGVERYRESKTYDFRSPPNRGRTRYPIEGGGIPGLPDWSRKPRLVAEKPRLALVGSADDATDRPRSVA